MGIENSVYCDECGGSIGERDSVYCDGIRVDELEEEIDKLKE